MSVIDFPSQTKSESLFLGQEFDNQGYERKSVEIIKNSEGLAIKFYKCKRKHAFTQTKNVCYDLHKEFPTFVKRWEKPLPIIFMTKDVTLFYMEVSNDYHFISRHFRQTCFPIDSSDFFKLKQFI